MSKQEETTAPGGLYETEIQRLQREADNYTRGLEYERKRYAIINDEYNQEQKSLNEIYARIKTAIPDKKREHDKLVERLSKHHQLQNEKVRLNDTIGDNKALSCEIDIMRKEIIFAKVSIRDMEKQIEELRKTATDANSKAKNLAKNTTEHNNWILALKAKSEDGKEQFELEVKKLQERLQDRYESEPPKDDELGEKKGKTDSANKKFDNPIEIMKIRSKNIMNKNREKSRLIAQYTRNAQVIEEAFKVIKEGSGITNIDEIVTTFIKAEEQNYALWNYVNQLGQECDLLEEQNATTDREIKRYETMANMSNNELHSRVKEMHQEAESLKKDILLKSEEVNDVQEDFDEIQDVVQQLVKQFQKAKFSTRVSQKMQYDASTQFNENNITMYLSELEEYFSTLIAYQATQRGEQNPAISSVPLEVLNDKEFNKKELQIQVPFEADEKKDRDGQSTTEAEEVETDPKQLYLKFNKLMPQGQIEISYTKTGMNGTQAQGKDTEA